MRFLIVVLLIVTIWVPFVALYSIWEQAPRDVLLLAGSLAANAFLLWAFTRLDRAAVD